MPLRLSRTSRVLALLLCLGITAGVWLGTRASSPGLLQELARATRRHGVSGVRVSIVSGFRACDPPAHSNAPVALCGAANDVPSRRTLSLIRRIADAAREGADPEAMHAAALALMLFPSAGGNHLDQSISYLQTASRLAEHPAAVLADLSAAHLMRARQARSPRDLYEGLEAADRALELEPANATARFNAAAALQEMGLAEQARGAWTRYLGVDSTSGWAREAGRRRALIQVPQPRQAPPRTASRAELEGYAATAPSGARELGWDDLLREWGAAVLAGDTATARVRLEHAEVLGTALVRRDGDQSLADAVATIGSQARGAAGLRRLAQAHVDVGEGRKALLDTNYRDACRRFRAAVQVPVPGPAWAWARTLVELCQGITPRVETLQGLGRLAAHADSARYPALAGRRLWILAFAFHSGGRYEEAMAVYGRAAAAFDRAGEREYAATARMQIGTMQSELGDAEAGYSSLYEALGVLREYPGSLGLYSGLYSLRNALLADGFPRAAMRVQEEAVIVAEPMRPTFRAETRLARARLRLAAGRTDIGEDVREAVEMMRTLDTEYVHGWIDADLRQTQAEAWLNVSPARAAAELDSVVKYFSTRPTRLLPALFVRARARLAAGAYAEAREDLHRAVAVLDTQRVHVSSAQFRAGLLEQSRRVFDQAVMLSVNGGRIDEALNYVERSRASFSPVGRSPDWARRPLRAPRGQVAVEFALVGDTLLAWILWEGGMRLSRRTVRRADLVRTVERVRSALELRSSDSVVLPGLESLYDDLIRPLRPHLEPGRPLVVVADGELAALPVAALRDRERGRYLVEEHPVRFASSLRDPWNTTARRVAGLPVTLVADPAFDRRTFPELERLQGAQAEVAAVAHLYPGAQVLEGAVADAGAIRAALLRGGVAHIAGHAVFDDRRPDRSYLVAAGTSGAPSWLMAAEIERMDLRALRLVVLSACQTARAQEGRSGGFAGLAGAFLAAGANGVIGSLWQVDDRATYVLMAQFHASYRDSGDAMHALREAQLRMLGSAAAELRSPAAWAGFRYVGQ